MQCPVQMWQRRTALQPAHAVVRSVTRRSAAAQLVQRLPMHASTASSRTDATTAAISNLTAGPEPLPEAALAACLWAHGGYCAHACACKAEPARSRARVRQRVSASAGVRPRCVACACVCQWMRGCFIVFAAMRA